MKKIIFILLMAVLGVNANAQNGAVATWPMAIYNGQWASDPTGTATNTDTVYAVFTASAHYDMHFIATVTKTSGTVGGALTLFGTDDDLGASANLDSLTNQVSGPTALNYANNPTVSNGTASYDFFYCGVAPYKYRYFIIRYISSGTQVSTFSGKAKARLKL